MPFVCATFVLICAAKMNVCAGLVFEILNILFLTVWRHSPPHVAQIALNQRSSFVLDLCRFVLLKWTSNIFLLLRNNKNNSGQWRHSPPHGVQISPNRCHSFVLDLCWFVPFKFVLYLFPVLKNNKYKTGQWRPSKPVPLVCEVFDLREVGPPPNAKRQ